MHPDIVIEEAPGTRRSGWRWAVGIADVLLIGAIVTVMNWPLVKVQAIVVDAPEEWEEAIREIARPVADSNLFAYDVRAVERRLRATFGTRAICGARLALPNQIRVRLNPTTPALWAESGQAISGSGILFDCYFRENNAPIWRLSSNALQPNSLGAQASVAIGAWAEVLRGDSRFADGVSEWYRDPRDGWIMVAADGRTRIALGWRNLENRASAVARLLGVREKAMSESCTIDARFDGYLVVRPGAPVAKAPDRRISNSGTAVQTASRGLAGGSRQGG